MTVIDPKLVAQAQKLINRMQPLSEMSAAQPGVIGRGHPDSSAPSGVVFTTTSVTHVTSLLEQFGGRVNLAEAHDSDSEMTIAIAWGTTALQALQHSSYVRVETPREFRKRLCSSYEGVPAGKVAARERTSVTTVRDARIADGRDAREGRKLRAVAK